VITLAELCQKVQKTQRKVTLLGVGPVSELTVDSTIRACKEYECPVMFIASRNQVDAEAFGNGYLMGGMNQKAFVHMIRHMTEKYRFNGPVYICRDHGGPWQRNTELDNKLDIETAMKLAKDSFSEDILSGFNLIHIDVTKCPHPIEVDDFVNWTLMLLEFCESVRISAALPEIDYEVGAEDIKGGITSDDFFNQFLEKLMEGINKKNLPAPAFIVGQTGTLVRIDRNVGKFDKAKTEILAKTADRYHIGFKEHNGDYLTPVSCRIHPDLGISAMNVAPEFGLVETDSYLELSKHEQALVNEGWIKQDAYSGFSELLVERTFTSAPWNKWMTSEILQLERNDIERDRYIRTLIARVCGHYVFHDPDISNSISKLLYNIDKVSFYPGGAMKVVEEKVSSSIKKYLECFNLRGLNRLTA
jgi:D-tagatose-1,6-bisphosphate aldolase subunit GatZ/KbaZ